MKNVLCLACAFLSLATLLTADEKAYDFHSSAAYKKLPAADKQRLEKVRRDQVLLWGALDMYAEDHSGNLPSTLDQLVPRYLTELPSDPFATQQTAIAEVKAGFQRSKGGLGYRFESGSPGNRAWVIASVGLPDFPYLADHGNVGLYVCKGFWTGGVNPGTGRLFKVQPDAAPGEIPKAPLGR